MKFISSSAAALVIAFASLASAPALHADEYPALEGVRSAHAVFDVRMADPEATAAHLNLIRQTFNDGALDDIDQDFKVVFIGPAVRLISTDRTGFDRAQRAHLDDIAQTVSGMAEDGIDLEICVVAAHAFDVDPETILPQISHVPNGFLSLIGYQERDYTLIPVY